MRNTWIKSWKSKQNRFWSCEFYCSDKVVLSERKVRFSESDKNKMLQINFGTIDSSDDEMMDFLTLSSGNNSFDAYFVLRDLNKDLEFVTYSELTEHKSGLLLVGIDAVVTYSYKTKTI